MGDDKSDAGPRSSFEAYRAEGDLLFKQQEFRKALETYNLALELRPDDRNCLVARSRCYLQLGNSAKALKDADASMKDDGTFFRGILCKADALYFQGDFEMALVFYHRGNRLRPEQHEFRLGIQKCQEAIDNSVGSPERVKLENKGDLSFFHKPQEDEQKKKKPGFTRPVRGVKVEEKKVRPISSSKDKTIKHLLGDLYADRAFLEQLLKEEDAKEKRTKAGEAIHKLLLDGLNYLDTRTDFWRQQKPMYARKRDREMQRASFAKRKETDPVKYVLKSLTEIDEAQSQSKYSASLKLCKQVLRTVEHWSDSDLPNKAEVLANLHSYMGNACLETGETKQALEHHQMDLRLAENYSMDDARSRALDNIGRVYARTGRFEEAIKLWEGKLPDSRSPLESTWLHHEIGRCQLELGASAKAKASGEKALQCAQQADDDMWQLNASVLVAQAEVKLGNYGAATDAFYRSLDMARLQNDQAAEQAIQRALEEINKKIVAESKTEPSKREEETKQDTEDVAAAEEAYSWTPDDEKAISGDTLADGDKDAVEE